jgi:hypothetical protein
MADREVVTRFKGDVSDLERAVAQANAGIGSVVAQEEAAAKAVKTATKAFDGQNAAMNGAAKGGAKAFTGATSGAAQSADKAADALKQLGDTSGDTDSALKAVAGALSLISPNAGAALSAVGDLAGGLEGAVKSTGILGVGLGTLAGAAVGIGVVAAAVYGVWTATEDTRKKTAEWEAAIGDVTTATKTLASAQAALGSATDKTAGFIGKLQIETAVLRGEIDQTDVKLGELGGTLADSLRPELDSARKAYQEQGAQIYKLNEAINSGTLSAGERVQAEIALNEAIGNQEEIKGKIAAIKQVQSEGSAAINAYGAAVRQSIAEEEASRAATEGRAVSTRSLSAAQVAAIGTTEAQTEATIKLTAAEKEEAAAKKDAAKAAEDAGASSAKLVDEVNALVGEPVSAVDELRAAYRELDTEILSQIEANQKAGISTESLEAARVDLARGTAAEIKAIKDSEAAAADKAAKDAKATREAEALATVGTALDVAAQVSEAFSAVSGAILDGWTEALSATQEKLGAVSEGLAELGDEGVNAGALTGAALTRAYLEGEVGADELSAAQKEQLEANLQAEEARLKQVEAAQREAAMKAFNMNKAASISSTIIAGALAVVQALAQLGPIAGAAAGIAIGATTGAAVASIAAEQPTFHSGGFVDDFMAGSGPGGSYAPDEVSTRLQTGEAVLSRVGRSMLGDETIRRANRGAPSSPVVNVTQVYDGQVIGRAVQDQIKTSSTLRRAVNATSRLGHRRR